MNYCLKLTSNVTKVNLPKPLANYKNIKFLMVSYMTGSTGNRIMRISVTGFNEKTFFDGINLKKYAKAYALPNSISTLMVDVSDSEKNDIEIQNRTHNTGATSIQIEIEIDEEYKDISPSNPMYLEFYIS